MNDDDSNTTTTNPAAASRDRFLTLFSQSHPLNPNGDDVTATIGDEFDEGDVLWTPNLDLSHSAHSSPDKSRHGGGGASASASGFRRTDSSGILAALPAGGASGENRLLCRKISLPNSASSSKMIPAVPKRRNSVADRDRFMSAPAGGGFYMAQSAPVMIPARERERKGSDVAGDELRGYGESDKEMMPPHEIVARGKGESEMTFSVLEGVGRTLKGRDLRQVRNAVWRQTGFLD